MAGYALATCCQHAHGLLICSSSRRAFIACDGSAALLIVELRSRRVTAVPAVGTEPDVPAFNTAARRLYAATESSIVFESDERGVNVQKFVNYDRLRCLTARIHHSQALLRLNRLAARTSHITSERLARSKAAVLRFDAVLTLLLADEEDTP